MPTKERLKRQRAYQRSLYKAAYPCVYIRTRGYQKLMSIFPKRFIECYAHFKFQHFIFRMKGWEQPIMVTCDNRFKLFTNKAHEEIVYELLRRW